MKQIVDVAGSGKQALEMLEDNHKQYSLIFMDYEMPEMSGIDTVKQIRKFEEEKRFKKIGIVMISGNSGE